MRRHDPGIPWRILAQGTSGPRVDVRSDAVGTPPFDEVAVGGWLHVERMSARGWFVRLGGADFHVEVGRGATVVYLQEGEIVADLGQGCAVVPREQMRKRGAKR